MLYNYTDDHSDQVMMNEAGTKIQWIIIFILSEKSSSFYYNKKLVRWWSANYNDS